MNEELLPDLLRLRGSVVAASDEFFGAKENLISPSEPVFVPEKYDARGQVYDGWETRRRRGPDGKQPDATASDWVIVRLGVPGVVRSIVVDTAFFLGNFPQACSADGCAVAGYPSAEELPGSGGWREIVARGLLTGSARHAFKVQSARRFTHVRLNIFPDGGIARLHVHGDVVPDPAMLSGLTTDLAALENGADVVASNDQNYYSPARNVISPGLSRVMHEGWETRRRAGPGTSGWSSGWPGRVSSTSPRSIPPGSAATSPTTPRCRRWTSPPARRRTMRAHGMIYCRRSGCCPIPRTGSA